MKKAGRTIAHCTCLAPGVAVREMDMTPSPAQLEKPRPDHLLVLVSGINSTYKDWKFSKDQLQKKLGDAVVIHASEASPGKKTLEGIDVTGLRLAEEVKQVVKDNPGLSRISFVGHSLGGLIARHAIAVLYKDPSSDRGVDVTAPNGGFEVNATEEEGEADTLSDSSQQEGAQRLDDSEQLLDAASTEGEAGKKAESGNKLFEQLKGRFKIGSQKDGKKAIERPPSRVKSYSFLKPSGKVTIAGLKPVHFITMASPHLGCRGNKQLPFLLGIRPLESLGPKIAHIAIGETGRHLFLADGTENDPPLLLKMTRDTEALPFMSALGAFELRIAYANATYDHLVGWRTSCIRREGELPKLPKRWPDEKYKFIMGVDDCPAIPLSEREASSSEGSARSLQSTTSRSAESGDADVAAREENHVAHHLEGVPVEAHKVPPQLEPANESQDWGNWSGKKTHTDTLEEEMIAGLQQVPWRKVDVSFNGAYLPMFAHFSITVKSEWLHWEGEAVVTHLADTLLRAEGILPPEPENNVEEVGAERAAIVGSHGTLQKEAEGKAKATEEEPLRQEAKR
ncbi:hypothetical protein KFL_001260070 [Klebsormidium nitens]|uniref:DUF676 domain-containing protein n=1 Tax=Klebsormidium nitens TaxID=105231 RepID=A0A1Y1I262_KLENI|nr:hypothetical protein KFL_001260070 [Klebsormidium nitens]|eukprot:GAQ82837.1 hypothetical protein KFL_001260070 [Klebsormidium nitens]